MTDGASSAKVLERYMLTGSNQVQIPIARPEFHENDYERLSTCLDSGWVGAGPKTEKFETLFAEYTQASGAIACSSGTTALHLALRAAGIDRGDEVLVPSFTWVASVNAILYQGAIPKLCDIELDHYNLDVTKLDALVTPKTKAVMPVHLFGAAAPMKQLNGWATSRGLSIIEDAACALGTWIDGQHAGLWGDFGTFSFHPRKLITTGEGGMCLTRSSKKLAELKALRNHGIDDTGLINHFGYNYRLSDLHSAIGIGQICRVENLIHARQKIARHYDNELMTCQRLITPKVPVGTTHPFQAYVCRLDSSTAEERDLLIRKLQSVGVQTRPGTHAVHRLPWHRKNLEFQTNTLTSSATAHDTTIALPIFPGLTETEQHYVIEQVRVILKEL